MSTTQLQIFIACSSDQNLDQCLASARLRPSEHLHSRSRTGIQEPGLMTTSAIRYFIMLEAPWTLSGHDGRSLRSSMIFVSINIEGELGPGPICRYPKKPPSRGHAQVYCIFVGSATSDLHARQAFDRCRSNWWSALADQGPCSLPLTMIG